MCDGGGVGIFGFADLANFRSDFSVSHLKTAVFRFRCLARFAGFLQFSLWSSVFDNNDGGFSNFSAQLFWFFWVCQESYVPYWC